MQDRQWRRVLRLAGPLIVVNLGAQLMGAVDTAVAGRVSPAAQAATGLGSAIFFLFAGAGMGVILGLDPLTSQAFGAGRPDQAHRTMRHGCVVAVLLAPVIALAIALACGALEWLGIEAELARETRTYVFARLLSVLPFLLVAAQRTYLQSAHRTTPIVAAMAGANVVNAALDWVLCFGWPALSIPALGVVGIGLSTVAASAAHALVLLPFVYERSDRPAGPIDRALCVRIVRVGAPVGGQLAAEIGLFTLIALLAGGMGTVAMAAHQVALTFVGVAFMVPLALGAATSVQVGRAIGSKDAMATRGAGVAGLRLGAACMCVSALSMWLGADVLARLMTSSSDVLPVAAVLIRIAAAFQLFDGIQAVGSGALRGAGLTDWALGANVVAYWLIGLPVSLLFGYPLGWGPEGLWWGLTAGLAVAAVALTCKFLSVTAQPIAALDVNAPLPQPELPPVARPNGESRGEI